MKAKEIQELIDFIANSGLAEVKIETDEFKLSVKKNSVVHSAKAVDPVPAASTEQQTVNTPSDSLPAANSVQPTDNSKYLEVKSPMIGTFYRTPNPDSEAFVNVGDTVSVGQTVCIIEAMKLFNEIEADVEGEIVEVLVEDGQLVEFGQPLFLVKTS